MERAMPGQQKMSWIGISLVTGIICLGAAEPQPSNDGQAVLSVEAGRGRDGAPMVLIPAGPFTMGTMRRRRRLEIDRPLG